MDKIITHPPNPEYSEGWDRIFGEKKGKDSAFKKVIRKDIEGMREELGPEDQRDGDHAE
tara:strand:+ start:117 stop:293 length:177 start_codon:yes stop_codon:yes gene_type:complete